MILVLTHKWFDMIASGEKKEEYRSMSKHNLTRLNNFLEKGNYEIEFRIEF